jgi:hypothetical protein
MDMKRLVIFRWFAGHGILGALCLILFALISSGQTNRMLAPDAERIGFPWDWSHEHVVFSDTNDLEVSTLLENQDLYG